MPENRKLPLIIAHRGASAEAPENTLAAFERAIAGGADGIEFDVRRAKDGVPIVFHDATLQRIARKKERASSFTSSELQRLNVGAWFKRSRPSKANPKFAGEAVPTLAQVFDFLRGYEGRIYVELKGKTEETLALVETVGRATRQTNLLPNIVLKSFKLEAIALSKKLFPEIRAAALFAPKIVSLLRRERPLIERAKAFGADELSLHHSLATRKTVASATRENLPVAVWTINRPVWIKRAAEIGVRAIITNHPARLVAARDEILSENSILGFR